MKNQAPEIILASASKSRKLLLKNAGLSFRVETSNLDEKQLKKDMEGTPVESLVLRLASAKAKAVYQTNKKSLIIGADQMLECENTLYDKPTDYLDAFDHLKKLQGKSID
jgi:septum formation protein